MKMAGMAMIVVVTMMVIGEDYNEDNGDCDNYNEYGDNDNDEDEDDNGLHYQDMGE